MEQEGINTHFFEKLYTQLSFILLLLHLCSIIIVIFLGFICFFERREGDTKRKRDFSIS